MEETASYCSASPERHTLYTPANSSIDDCYTQVMGQFPYGYEDEDLQRSPNIRHAQPPGMHPAKLGLGLNDQQYKDPFVSSWNDGKYLPRGFEDWTAASTRFLKVANIDTAIQSTVLFSYLHEIGDIQEYNTAGLQSGGVCVVSYFDLRDAIAAYIKIKTDQNWTVQYCSQAYYSVLVSTDDNHAGTGEPMDVICAITSGQQSSKAGPVLYSRLHDFGTIIKYTALRSTRLPAFLLSFSDHQTASDVVEILDGQYLMGFHLRAALYKSDPTPQIAIPEAYPMSPHETVHMSSSDRYSDPDIWSPHPIRPHLGTPFKYSVPDVWSPHPVGSHLGSPFGYDLSILSREGRSPETPGYDSESISRNLFSGIYPSSQSAPYDHLHRSSADNAYDSHSSPHHSPCRAAHSRCPHSPEASPSRKKDSSSNHPYDKSSSQLAVPGKNIIDLDRIARGLDTRTTVMLRNIPNKVDQQTLKDYIDETSRGLYNFLYLRIDFRNICNVGYAFINFLDPLDIIDFVKAKSGTRWNKFNSEKVLDVTYANIQGIDQLVEKFRNSSVMDQDPAYRPKLFYSSGPHAGTEMEFPAANNILKKCRSISAAQQIGLFAPKLSAASKGVWRKRD